MSDEKAQSREEILKEMHGVLGATPRTIKRPSWGFDLPAAMLPPVPDGGDDPFEGMINEKGRIPLDFIYLAADEETDSVAHAASSCASRGVDISIGQVVLVYSRAKFALWKANGRVLDTAERDRIWSRLGPECRDLVLMAYSKANGLENMKNAQAVVLETFRVATLQGTRLRHLPGPWPGEVARRFASRDLRSDRHAREGLQHDVCRSMGDAHQPGDVVC